MVCKIQKVKSAFSRFPGVNGKCSSSSSIGYHMGGFVVEGVAYAGDTELVETEEASVLALPSSSSSKGFLPQHRVVIMQ